MSKRLSRRGEVDFCYEAGGCGYGISVSSTAFGQQSLCRNPAILTGIGTYRSVSPGGGPEMRQTHINTASSYHSAFFGAERRMLPRGVPIGGWSRSLRSD
jgi:hypothetical protein